MGDDANFYYNVATGQVEEGHLSDSDDLMGPYPTREQAAAALDTARARNERWDAEDKKWADGE